MSELTAKAPASTWLTVTEAARRLGISERAVQRRCKSGKLCAELVPTPTGHQWQIAADALDNEPMCHDSADASDSDSRDTSDIRAATAVEQETTLPTAATATAPTVPIPEAATHTTAPTPGPDAVLIEELRDQVKYLRSALEARDRDAAELRAALRDALKMSARALTDGSDRQVLAEAAQNAQDAAHGPHRDGTGKETPNTRSGPNTGSTTRRYTRPARPFWKVFLGLK